MNYRRSGLRVQANFALLNPSHVRSPVGLDFPSHAPLVMSRADTLPTLRQEISTH